MVVLIIIYSRRRGGLLAVAKKITPAWRVGHENRYIIIIYIYILYYIAYRYVSASYTRGSSTSIVFVGTRLRIFARGSNNNIIICHVHAYTYYACIGARHEIEYWKTRSKNCVQSRISMYIIHSTCTREHNK